MQPSINRRIFLQGLLGIPMLACLRPKAAQAQAQIGLAYSDSEGNTDLTALNDGSVQTGIEYMA